MNYTLTIALGPLEIMVLGGLLGGALNALCSNDLHVLPSRSFDRLRGRHRVVRIGLGASVAVGIFAATAVYWAAPGPDIPPLEPYRPPAWLIIGSLARGFLVSRLVTNEVDKRLLRLALTSAVASPAAHPDTALAMKHAPASDIYRMALDLVPRRLMAPPRSPLPAGSTLEHPPQI